jgi:ubiquinone/menaquinone biosynthesis C-methylase UbiE
MATGWDRMARWRDQQMAERGDLWHRAIIDPTLLAVVGHVRGLRVLDLGCGNGYLTRRFAAAGAAEAIGIDRSRPSILLARSRERRRRTGAEFRVGDAGRIPRPSGSVDLVVANMALMDVADAEAAVREVARVLTPAGRFVFSVSHPCFDLDDRSVWSVERGYGPDGVYRNTVWRKVRGYRDELVTQVPWNVDGRRVIRTASHHRTLATYSRYLRRAGFVILRLEEPFPRPEAIRKSPQGPYMAEIPLHLVIEAVRRSPVTPGRRTSAGSPRRAVRRSGSRGRRRGTGSARRGSIRRS